MRIRIVAAIILTCLPYLSSAQTARVVDVFDLTDLHPKLHGLSGIKIVAQGSQAVVVTDRGYILNLSLKRAATEISQVTVQKWGRILDPNGAPVSDRQADAESVAIDKNGIIHVAFERDHRVWSYVTPTSRAVQHLQPEPLKQLQNNSGLEALASAPNGDIVGFPERSGAKTRPFPLMAIRPDGVETIAQLPRTGPYLVVGADFGPDGLLYILERSHWFVTFKSRIRTLDINTGETKTLWQSRYGQYDNLEGLSVWQTPSGEPRITLISDDNGQWYQTSQIVELELTQ